jgi:ABC-type branched-subunit amino acid transport system substrate-binding protein
LLCSVVLACTARNVEEGAAQGTLAPPSDSSRGEEAADAGGAESFGDLESPCGPGSLSVEPSEAGGSPDRLRIGVANDRSSQIRTGLNKELWDTAVAFADWCNDQGGIGGLQIEPVDLDGKVLEVEAAMANACTGVFMLVGGGHVQDNLQFTRRPESDFHLCHLVDIPAFAASAQKADSNGQVQVLPRSAARFSTNSFDAYREAFPEVATMAIAWGQLPTMEAMKELSVETASAVGFDVVADLPYPVTGMLDWTPLAQQIIDSGAESLFWIGEPTNLGSLLGPLRTQGWEGQVFGETNVYDPVLIDSAGDAAEGLVLRTPGHPFEETDRWDATDDYLRLLAEHTSDAKVAMLGVPAMSAWLLFATAANDCGESNDGLLARACVLSAADAVEDWTAGGLHTASDPGGLEAPPAGCTMLLVVHDGRFERLHPEIGGKFDDGEGFTCVGGGETVSVPANEGLGITSPDQPL